MEFHGLQFPLTRFLVHLLPSVVSLRSGGGISHGVLWIGRQAKAAASAATPSPAKKACESVGGDPWSLERNRP